MIWPVCPLCLIFICSRIFKAPDVEVRVLQALTTQSIENISENISENAFHAVRSKSAQKLAFKVASHTDGIVDDAIELLESFLQQCL